MLVRLVHAIFRICGNESQPGLQLAERMATPLQNAILLFFLFHTFVPRVFKGFQFFVRSHLIMPVSLNSKWLLDGHTLQGGHNGLSLVGHILKRCSTMMVAHQGLFFSCPKFCVLFMYRNTCFARLNFLRPANNFFPLKKDLCPNRSSFFSYKREKSSDILTLISLITMQSSAIKWWSLALHQHGHHVHCRTCARVSGDVLLRIVR